jgi:CheY-like chemotaxis protein
MGILIIDDSPDQQVLLRAILGKAGHTDLLSANSAKTAFPMLDMDGHEPPNQVDLILMDVLMPELDGVEACRQIKSRPHLCDIPIIMVTAKSDLSNLQAAFAAGANDYITKPVNSVELLARASSALALKKEMDCRKAREGELRRSNDALQKALRDVKVRSVHPVKRFAMMEDSGNSWRNISVNIPRPNSATESVSHVSKSFILEFTRTSCYDFSGTPLVFTGLRTLWAF